MFVDRQEPHLQRLPLNVFVLLLVSSLVFRFILITV